MTGWGLADEVLLAGTMPGGRSVWVVAPLVESDNLRASPPLRLCAMSASATVALTCRGLRIGADRLVKIMTATELDGDTAGAILFFSALSLGVASAAIELLRERESGGPLAAAADDLDRELAAARGAVNRQADADATPGDRTGDAAEVRAWCIDLGVRAAHAAVVASGGSANLLDHTAQRLFREAMVYTLIAQTRDLQTASLHRLTSRSTLAGA